jgi:TolB-like protein
MSLIAELKRRNVIRVAIAYMVVSWLTLQAGDVLFGLLGVPDWGLRLLFGILALGFPVALVLSWIYELTPEGLRRDPGHSVDPAFSRQAGHRLNVTVIVLLLIAIALFVVSTFLPRSAPQQQTSNADRDIVAPSQETAVAQPAQASIAVLPFEALSADESDVYFGKGIAEELLNALTQFPGLKVAARTSAFAFEGRNVELREIGEQLDVAHVLEGSVRRSGERLRVTAQLIRVEDGFHLWSETYDRTLTDVFAIQDDIVRQLSRTLEVRLGVGGGAGRAERGNVDPQAYEQYLRGLALWGERDNPPSNRRAALAAFRLSAEIAPDFADAWAAIGNVSAFSTSGSLQIPNEQLIEQGDAAFKRALELDPDNAAAHSGMVSWAGRFGLSLEAAHAHLVRALELAPNRAESHYSAAFFWALIGDVDAATLAYDRAAALDPLNRTVQRSRAIYLISIGRDEQGFRFFDECLRQDCLPGLTGVFGLSAMIIAGDRERIEAWYEVVAPSLQAMMNEVPAGHSNALRATLVLWFARSRGEQIPLSIDGLSAEDLLADPPLVGLVGPMLASELSAEVFFDFLDGMHGERRLLTQPFSLTPLYRESHTYPDRVLAHPRYLELWSQPGMAGLEAARRANGQVVGLPTRSSGPAQIESTGSE